MEYIVLIDKNLVNEKVMCHSNVNTSTISLECKDLFNFIEYFEHKYVIV